MALFIVSFLAWVLTILAPCILPVLPVVLWASLEGDEDKRKPYVVIFSLMFSIIVFSILLKSSTLLLWVNPIVWKLFSGGILIVFWLIVLFPRVWEYFSWRVVNKSSQGLNKSSEKKWFWGYVLVWFSLGPVFSSCSPTYLLILAVILPTNFFSWFLYLLTYVFGLWIALFFIVFLWQKLIWKLKWISSPSGIFKKVLWVVFLLIWVGIILWYDKILETKILDSKFFDITKIEERVVEWGEGI